MEVMKIKRDKFYVYSDIFEAGLSAREIAVFAYLSRCANKEGVAFPSIANIAGKCKMGRETIVKSVDRLEKTGFIRKQNCYSQMKNGKFRQTSNKYFIKKYLDNKLNKNKDLNEQAVLFGTGGGSKQVQGSVLNEYGGSSKQEQEINNKLNNINSPLSVSQYEEDGLTEILGAIHLSSFEENFARAVRLAVTDLYYSEQLVVGGRAVPRWEVRSRLSRLDQWAVRIVYENISKYGCKAASLGNYLKICLYNAVLDGETCAAVIENGE